MRNERLASRLASQELLTAQLVRSRTWRTLQAMGRVANQVIPAKRLESQAAPVVEQTPEAPTTTIVERPPMPLDDIAVPEPEASNFTQETTFIKVR